MKLMLVFLAGVMAISLGVGSAYADTGDHAPPAPLFTAAQDSSQGVPVGAAPSHKLFSIGRLEVRVWAPVPLPHDTDTSLDPAARTVWGAG
jgi:hypothetical protein